MGTEFDTALAALADAQADADNVPGCSGIPECVAVKGALVDLQYAFLGLKDAIGLGSNFQSGLFKQVSCDAINGRYQLLLIFMCDDFATPLISFFEVRCLAGHTVHLP